MEKDCPYSAQKIYLERNRGHRHWPMSAVCDIEDHPGGYGAALRESLEGGPYGRCVYECDNDVCDHQTVNMEFESGATANMTMNAFTENMSRCYCYQRLSPIWENENSFLRAGTMRTRKSMGSNWPRPSFSG